MKTRIQQVSHCSGTSNILGSPRQPRLQLHGFMKRSLRVSMQGSPDMCLALAAILRCGGIVYNPVLLSLTLKSK
ncbi:hypothetical protein LEMLEM_LOCUS21819, partial [Lemmus lemmus]